MRWLISQKVQACFGPWNSAAIDFVVVWGSGISNAVMKIREEGGAIRVMDSIKGRVSIAYGLCGSAPTDR